MCWWEMMISSRSSMRRPCPASPRSSASSDEPHVRPAVEQRQRVVLHQVRVDGADLKWGRYGQAVDARLGGARRRGSLVYHDCAPLLVEKWVAEVVIGPAR